MSFTDADMNRAVEKLSAVDLTDAELDAIVYLLTNHDEVSGYTAPPARGLLADLAGRLTQVAPSPGPRPSGFFDEADALFGK